MDYQKPRGKPEQTAQTALRNHMEKLGWLTIKMHGNKFQNGLPDLFCSHPTHGTRWIEMKTPTNSLTTSQKVMFKKMTKFGVRIWVLRGVSEYQLLFYPPNWHMEHL